MVNISNLEDRLPLNGSFEDENEARAEIKRRIINKKDIPEALFFNVFGEDRNTYEIFMYVKETLQNKKRRCGNPFPIHFYRMMEIAKDFLEAEYKDIQTVYKTISLHDIIEEVVVKKRSRFYFIMSSLRINVGDLSKRLSEIEKKTKKEIKHKKDILKSVELLTNWYDFDKANFGFEKELENYSMYINNIFNYALKRYNENDCCYDLPVIVKLIDRVDNIQTLLQFERVEKGETKALLKQEKILLKTEPILKRTEDFIEKTGNYTVNVIYDVLKNEFMPREITRVTNEFIKLIGIKSDDDTEGEHHIRTGPYNLSLDYEISLTEEQKQLKFLESKITELNELNVKIKSFKDF